MAGEGRKSKGEEGHGSCLEKDRGEKGKRCLKKGKCLQGNPEICVGKKKGVGREKKGEKANRKRKKVFE